MKVEETEGDREQWSKKEKDLKENAMGDFSSVLLWPNSGDCIVLLCSQV